MAHFGEMVQQLNTMQQREALGQQLQQTTIGHPHKRGASYKLYVRSNSKGACALEDALSAMLIRSYRSGEMAKEEGFYRVLKDLNGPTSTPQQQFGAWTLPPSVQGAGGDEAMRDG